MKGKLLCLSAAVLAAVAGCSSTPESAPEPLKVNAVYQERCYSMDQVEQEAAGRAFLEKGQQFYYQLDCSKYTNLSLSDQAGEDVADVSEGAALGAQGDQAGDAPAAISTDAGNDPAGATGVVAPAGSNGPSAVTGSASSLGAWSEAKAKTPKEPTCYFDKETAGRGDLPPCPWDEEEQKYIKE